MIARTALLAIAVTLVAAVPASAAEVSLTVSPAGGVRLGDAIGISGRATDKGVPLVGRVVRLEVKRHPFKGDWENERLTTTAADGSFSFSPRLGRNHRVRVRLLARPPSSPYVIPETDTLSPRRNAYVLPAFRLTFSQRGPRVLRLRQVYRVSKGVKLTAPTRFYVGPCRADAAGRCTARRAKFRSAAPTRRLRARRYVSTTRFRLPRSFQGRFQYVSCFVYSPGSGMGDPGQRCPRRFARLG